MEQTGSFRAAVPLSVLTAVLGQCITSGSAMPARLLLLQGFPMALGIGLLSYCLMPAEGKRGFVPKPESVPGCSVCFCPCGLAQSCGRRFGRHSRCAGSSFRPWQSSAFCRCCCGRAGS